MMKRTLISLCTLALLSACGSEMDFANHDLSQNHNALGKNAPQSINPENDCENVIEMTRVYSKATATAVPMQAEYCVTVCEVQYDSSGYGSCLADSNELFCAATPNFELAAVPHLPDCYTLANEKRGLGLICATCGVNPMPTDPHEAK